MHISHGHSRHIRFFSYERKNAKKHCCHISFTQMVIEVRYILEELTLVVTKVYVGSKIICSKMLCNAANTLPNWKWQLGSKDILEVCGQCIKNRCNKVCRFADISILTKYICGLKVIVEKCLMRTHAD